MGIRKGRREAYENLSISEEGDCPRCGGEKQPSTLAGYLNCVRCGYEWKDPNHVAQKRGPPETYRRDAELIEEEPALSLVEQGLIRHSTSTNAATNNASTVRRDSKGQRKRFQVRTKPKQRIASSRKKVSQETGRIFSSMMTRVRETISNLHEEGIPEEIIEYMSEHVSEEEEEEQVPVSFSSLTESQEIAQAQSNQLGLRRID